MLRLFGFFLLFLFLWYLMRGILLVFRSIRVFNRVTQDARQTFDSRNGSSGTTEGGREKDITSRVRIIDENSSVDR